MREKLDRYFLRGCFADNVIAGAPVGTGSTFGTAELTFSGDTVQVPLSIPGFLTGSEGSYTFSPLTGNTGVVGAGTQRVTLVTDVALPTGANSIGQVTANAGTNLNTSALALEAGNLATLAGAVTATVLQANVKQINGVTVLMGNGASGTGAQRVTIANDSTGILAGVTTVTTVTTLSTLTGGGVAHDGVDSGNPVKVGSRAIASLSGSTLVGAADRADMLSDIDGVLLTRNGVPLGDLINERISNTDGSSTAFANFGSVTGKHNIITSVTVHNAHATTNGYVDLRDGSAGSVIWTFPLPATGGATHNFDPPLRQPTAATALAYDVSAAITTIYVSVNGFQSKV